MRGGRESDVPRGPSTVTTLDLMWILTAQRSVRRFGAQEHRGQLAYRSLVLTETLASVYTSSWLAWTRYSTVQYRILCILLWVVHRNLGGRC